jgi:hypothetical protein
MMGRRGIRGLLSRASRVLATPHRVLLGLLLLAGGTAWQPALAAAGVTCPPGSVPSIDGTMCTATFGFTGTRQTFRVPSGVKSLNVTAIGAVGGGVVGGFGVPPGKGGQESGTVPVQPGQGLTVVVGGAGQAGSTSSYAGGPGGFGGGGAGGAAGSDSSTGAGGYGGGGGSFVFGASGLLLAAGGGGGGGSNSFALNQPAQFDSAGGSGGATAGSSADGDWDCCWTPGGTGIDGTGGSGGHSSFGGTGGQPGSVLNCGGTPGTAGDRGTGPAKTPGSLGSGGAGGGTQALGTCTGGEDIWSGLSTGNGAGGGGGGYYGGGGGGSGFAGGGGGGGGSGYAAPSVTGATSATGASYGNGSVTISFRPGGAAAISGRVLGGDGKGLSGITVSASGSDGSGSAVTGSDGGYSIDVVPGTYDVSPEGPPPGSTAAAKWDVTTCEGTAGPGSCSVTVKDGDTKTASFAVPSDHVTITLAPQGVLNDGFGIVNVTITDQDSHGNPVAGKTVEIEPPVTYDQPAVICDGSNRLVYPTRLGDGSFLGAHFYRVTDSSGQIHLTMFMGRVPGDWLIEAGEPDQPSSWDHKTLTAGGASGRSELPVELPSLLWSTNTKTLADFTHGSVSDILTWLGLVKTGSDASVLSGIGFAPIWATSPAGGTSAGVVLFADGVRQQVFDYLDGKSSTPPPEAQAIVIDAAALRELEFATYLAGHSVARPPDRLPDLNEWAIGGRLDIGEGADGRARFLPVPAHGQPHAGFAQPQGNQDLLYEYGPYPPFGADPAVQATFSQCVAPVFGTSVSVHSPLSVVVSGGHEQAAGVTAGGRPEDTLPGAIVSYQGRHLSSILLAPGGYGLQVTGTGSGPAHLVITTVGATGASTSVFGFTSHRGGRGTLSISGSHVRAALRFGGHTIKRQSGVGLVVAGLPAKLRRGHRDTLTLTLRDQFGAPAAGITLQLQGRPLGHAVSAVSDVRGDLSLSLEPAKSGTLTARFTGAGYRLLTRQLKVP